MQKTLIRDGLWGIVNEMEMVPTEERRHKQNLRQGSRDKAPVIIVLAIEPNLLYLTGANPTDPVVVWNE